MYVGLDVSEREIVCVGKSKYGQTLYEDTWETSETGIDSIIAHVGRNSVFAVEASTKGLFVYDYLVSKRIQVKMANPNRLRQIAESEIKTDRNDASIIADYLRMGTLPTCNVPTPEMREVRDVVKHRRCMVIAQTMMRNKIRAILSRDGIDIEDTDILGINAYQEIVESKQKIKGELQKEALDRFIRMGHILGSEIADYDQMIREKYRLSKEAQLLDAIPGIAGYSAVHIASSIGDISNFSSHYHLASYAGLVPKIYQSGDTRNDGGLKKKVDRSLRWILIEDAWAAVRTNKRFRKYYMKKIRRYGNTKRGRSKAIITVARKLVKIIYMMLTRGETYRE